MPDRRPVLAASALLLPACLEADVQADVKADGSGTLGMGMKFSDKFVEIVKKMEKIDAKQDIVKQARDMGILLSLPCRPRPSFHAFNVGLRKHCVNRKGA